jgi:membrane-associated phospholipid phosphatase
MIDIIGYFGPQLLCFLSVILLLKKWNSLSLYLVGYFSNIILTYSLKGIIQEPRPTEDKKLLELALRHGKRIGYDKYGCPSGHVSSVVYSTTFVYLVLQNPNVLGIYFLVSLATMYQRVKYNNHTIHQVIVGAIVGFFSAIVFFYFAREIITGDKIEKPDDNAPI